MKQLSVFLDQHFPDDATRPEHTTLPGVASAMEKKKGLSAMNMGEEEGEFMSLKDIIAALMNNVVTNPADPYMVITERHWPPHIELLLSAQIATKHVTDGNRIRLVDFRS